MNARTASYIVLFWMLASWGCARLQPAATDAPAGPSVETTSAAYIQRAEAHEERAEWQQALLAWQVAARLDEGNTRITAAMSALESRIADEAKIHFEKGLTYFQSEKYNAAQMQFLKTVRLDPNHRGAIYYLKTRLPNTKQTLYRVKRGDSYSKIAHKTYKDAQKAYLIAYFNDRNPHQPLLTGTMLLLPALDPRFLDPRIEINEWLSQARSALDGKQYERVLELTARIDEVAAGHPDARQLRDEARYRQGLELIDQQRYDEALERLQQVGNGHPHRNNAIDQARRHIRNRDLEDRLQDAERYLKRLNYSEVIAISREVLQQNPESRKAKELSNAANYALGKQLLDKGDAAKAVNYLKAADPSYQDTEQLLSTAQARMRALAETHYRSGVKHFINEDLERAVKAWERALSLNPNHPKARQDMENARRLIKKWKAIDLDKEGAHSDPPQ
jgi:tetratricopeptide (TPR) repeat protein